MPYRSGFVTVIGRPNVGKSTLVNRISGQKISIVSDKPQTTRNRIMAVVSGDGYQIVFLDTPGIHKPRHRLGEFMLNAVRQSLEEVDLVLMVVEAHVRPGPGDHYVAAEAEKAGTACLLVVNKVDLVSAGEAEVACRAYGELGRFASVLPVSAARGDNLDELTRAIIAHLPEGPQYYPEDTVTDQPERFVVAELVREKVFELTRDEVPHSVAVTVDEMTLRGRPFESSDQDADADEDVDEDSDAGSDADAGEVGEDAVAGGKGEAGKVYVKATIHVEKDSQKGIIIGAKGRMLREIGQRARIDTERLLGSPVFLELWVKVNKGWRNEEAALRRLGYHEER